MENVEKLIYELKFNYVESLDTSNLCTPEHKKYNCEIANKKGAYRFTYQCNPKYHKITKESLLACVISDSQCYTSCLVGDDELGALYDYLSEKGEI